MLQRNINFLKASLRDRIKKKINTQQIVIKNKKYKNIKKINTRDKKNIKKMLKTLSAAGPKSLTDNLIHSLVVDGKLIVKLRLADGYGSLTHMCKAGGKQSSDYMRLEKTKAFVEKLSSVTGPETRLIEKINGGKDQETWVHPNILIDSAQWLGYGYEQIVRKYMEEKGIKLIEFEPKQVLKEIRKPKSYEHCVRNKLQKQRGGEMEVKCKGGDIDLLTSTHIVEIKKANQWKGAVGQVIIYAMEYPLHKKVICLFRHEKITEKRKKYIVCCCKTLNIDVWWK